jgi:hypothetical protein
MSEYDYNSVVTPIFIEKRENLIEAFPTDYSENALNNNHSNIVFQITSYDNPANLFDSEFIIEIELRSDANTVMLTQDSTLINNFHTALFDEIKLEINGEIIESIQNPYIVSTMMKLISKSKDYFNEAEIYGFILDSTTSDNSANNIGRNLRKTLYNSNTKKIRVSLKLEDIFGFCNDYRKPLYKIPFKITLTRNVDNKFIFHTADAAKVGYLKIVSLQLNIPLNELNDDYKFTYLNQFNHNKEIDILYNQRFYYFGTTDNSSGQKSLHITTSNQPPELVVICFTPVTAYEYEANNSLFSNGEISKCQLQIGSSQRYPNNNPLLIDRAAGFHEQTYKNYIKACKSNLIDPMLSYLEFRLLYPMYVFETNKQDIDLWSNCISVNIHIHKDTATQFNYHVLYLENKWYKSKLMSNGMSRFEHINYNKK